MRYEKETDSTIMELNCTKVERAKHQCFNALMLFALNLRPKVLAPIKLVEASKI